MRLMQTAEYRGNQICVYLVLPEEDANPLPRPALGVRVNGQTLLKWSVLPGVSHLDDALRWGRQTVDRAAGRAWRVLRRPTRHHHVLRLAS